MTNRFFVDSLISNRGRVYRIRAHEIPILERTARGTALVNLIPLGPEEHIQAIIDTRTYEDAAYLFFVTFLALFTVLFSVFALVSSLMRIAVSDDSSSSNAIPTSNQRITATIVLPSYSTS